jgi:hypothetical protein
MEDQKCEIMFRTSENYDTRLLDFLPPQEVCGGACLQVYLARKIFCRNTAKNFSARAGKMDSNSAPARARPARLPVTPLSPKPKLQKSHPKIGFKDIQESKQDDMRQIDSTTTVPMRVLLGHIL